MRVIAAILFALFTTGLCQMAWASPEDEVHARFEEWIRTYNTNDADRLSELYDQNARLLATGGTEKPIDGRDAIRAYFAPNFKRGPQSIVFDHDDTTNVFSDVGIETGYYHFNVNDAEGKSVSLPSRYTLYLHIREKERNLDDSSPSFIQSPEPDSRAGSIAFQNIDACFGLDLAPAGHARAPHLGLGVRPPWQPYQRHDGEVPCRPFRESTTRCCTAPCFFTPRPQWVNRRHRLSDGHGRSCFDS